MKTLIASALMLLAPALALAQSSTTQPAPKAASKPAAKAQPAKQNTAKSTAAKSTKPAAGKTTVANADLQSPGRFHVEGKGFKYHMAPVATSTGTVRLEDQRAGAVWIQIANKSMLMNQKLGQRMADECMSPAQVTVAEAIKKNPPPSLLDAPAPR
jgi:glucose/arabinose dehydrogenase